MRLGVVLVSEPRSVLSWSWKQSLSIQSRCSCSLAARISSPLKISFKEARTLECAPCSKSPTSQAKRQCYGVKFRLPIPEYKTFTSCHWMFRISRSGQLLYPHFARANWSLAHDSKNSLWGLNGLRKWPSWKLRSSKEHCWRLLQQ